MRDAEHNRLHLPTLASSGRPIPADGLLWNGRRRRFAAVMASAWGAVLIATAGLVSTSASAGSHLYDPDTGYRVKHYRAAVPDDVPGGRRITIQDVDDLRANQNALLLDVMPSTGFSFDPKSGEWRLSKRHNHISGSTWLPDVGLGRLSPTLSRYLKSNLARLTQGDTGRAIVVYCQSDCWMAWNAVQRAAKLGYTNVHWYPDGIDGWRDYDRELVPAEPVPVDVTPPPGP